MRPFHDFFLTNFLPPDLLSPGLLSSEIRWLSFRQLLSVILIMAFASPTLAQLNSPYPPPKHLGDPAKLGLGIQRTMTLLATSSVEHRNTVHILFYGQSITEQAWWRAVYLDLKRRFPKANLIVDNLALGGFASQMLVKTAETDLYPSYPDLVIFHVYGAHDSYENIIRRIRERTTAEVLIQTDHVTNDADLNEETDPAKLRPDGKIWNSFMNYLHLPTLAQKYGCGIVDQRNLWKQYLRDYKVPAAQLLKDGVHQNDYGNYLMAALVNAYLVPRSDTHIKPMNCDTVRTLIIGKDIQWKDGKITLPFEGNRVDLLAGDGAPLPAPPARHTEPGKTTTRPDTQPGKNTKPSPSLTPGQGANAGVTSIPGNVPGNDQTTAGIPSATTLGQAKPGDAPPVAILIDGKKPSEIPEVYSFTRALSTPGGKWPVILKMGWEKPLQAEDWTMEATKDPANPKQFTFTVIGSKTGMDGAGRSDQRFVSKSGRIVIEPEDWNVEYSLSLPGIKPVPDKLIVRWQSVPHAIDSFNLMGPADKAYETSVTIAQGLTNGKHTLELTGNQASHLAAIRIYRPPFASTEK